MSRLFVLAIIQSLLLSLGQVALKFGLMRMEPFAWSRSFLISVFWNLPFALSGVCFGLGSLLWMYIVKHYPLSQAYPLVSLSYVFGLLAAMVFFQEEVGLAKWAGVALIGLGCWLISSQPT